MAADEVDAQAFFTKFIRRFKRSRTSRSDEGMAVEDIEDVIEDIQMYKRPPPKFSNFTKKELLADVYKMDHPRRGKALVINNKEFTVEMQKQGYGTRTGTDVDCTTLCSRLKALGFEVERHHNATCEEISKVFYKASQEDHTDADCFVGVLLSHGEEDTIMGTDGKVEVKHLFQFFKAHNCQSLAGKPKLFFIQACRGKQLDRGVGFNTVDAKRSLDEAEEGEVIRIPNEADFLLSFSTVPGYYSWRNSLNGSWYIQALVLILDTMGTTTEIQKLLTKLNKLVAYYEKYTSNTLPSNPNMHGMKQMPSFTSMLTKDLYFFPKQQTG